MDGRWFDDLIRSLGQAHSRRTMLGLILAGLVAPLSARVASQAACGDVCAGGCPFHTVQEAVEAASPGDTIQICAGTYNTVNVTIDQDLTLVGAGPDATTLDAAGGRRVFWILSGTTVTIRGLTITGGNAVNSSAGGIANFGSLTIADGRVTGNKAGRHGGGIYSYGGTVTLGDGGSVTGNTASASGGGIYNFVGTVTLEDSSSLTGNEAGEAGGGICTTTDATTTIAAGATVVDNEPDDCAGDGTIDGVCPTR